MLEMHICIKLRPLGREVEGPSLCESHDENAAGWQHGRERPWRLLSAHPAHISAHTAKGGEGKA